MSKPFMSIYRIRCASTANDAQFQFQKGLLTTVLIGLLVLSGCAPIASSLAVRTSASKLQTDDSSGSRVDSSTTTDSLSRSNANSDAHSTEADANVMTIAPLALAPESSMVAASLPPAGIRESSVVQRASFQESVGNAGMQSGQIDPIIGAQRNQRMNMNQAGDRLDAGQFEASRAAPHSMGRSHASVPLGQGYDSYSQMNPLTRDHSQYYPGQNGDSRTVHQQDLSRSGIVNVVGAEFRSRNPTATEIMILMKSENQMLRNKIVGLNSNVQKQQQIIAQERAARESVEAELVGSNNQNRELREMIAKLQVEVEQLQLDKQAVEQRADRALREIESALDSTLINSVIKTMNDK